MHGSGALTRWLLENDLVDEVLASTLDPTAIEMDLPGNTAGALSVLLEGSIAGVAARTRDTIRLLGQKPLGVLRGE